MMECIILAGGLGTRLKSAIGDQPKCMAMVNDQPFLHYLFEYLEREGCDRVILSLGYKHEVITKWLETQNRPFEIVYTIEDEPLGTGGAIRLAMEQATADQVIVLNGDTLFPISLKELVLFHRKELSYTESPVETTLALKYLENFDRYGTVGFDERYIITAFREKQYQEKGFINGGIYCIEREVFLEREFSRKFSFEKDYLELLVKERVFRGFPFDSYFIDIGIPTDYEKAQRDFTTIF